MLQQWSHYSEDGTCQNYMIEVLNTSYSLTWLMGNDMAVLCPPISFQIHHFLPLSMN